MSFCAANVRLFGVKQTCRRGTSGAVELQFDIGLTLFSSLAREDHLPERI
jgi:hypothetical protein